MMNRKYFFFDIDGTLAVGTPGDQYIPESTQYALKQLEAEGHLLRLRQVEVMPWHMIICMN